MLIERGVTIQMTDKIYNFISSYKQTKFYNCDGKFI